MSGAAACLALLLGTGALPLAAPEGALPAVAAEAHPPELQADSRTQKETPSSDEAAPTPSKGAPADKLKRSRELRRFGDSLLLEGDAYRAIGAYKQSRFLSPSAASGLRRYRIALAYFSGKQLQAAYEATRSVRGPPQTLWSARRLGASALYLDRQFEAALQELSGDPSDWASYLRGFALIHSGRFEAARTQFEVLDPQSALRPQALTLAKALRAPRLPYRSPVLAGLLAILPGLGHLYLGQWSVAATALLWNGAFGWGLYETIHASLWGLTALLGVLESVWYFGSIFGAVSGAQRFNRDASLNFVESLDASVPAPPAPAQPNLPQAPPLSLELNLELGL